MKVETKKHFNCWYFKKEGSVKKMQYEDFK